MNVSCTGFATQLQFRRCCGADFAARTISRDIPARPTPKSQRGQYGDVGSRFPIRNRFRLALPSAPLEIVAKVLSKLK
jgi:hypothetical protein